MRNALLSVVLIAMASSAALAGDDKKYSLDDLKELVAEKSYKEAYLHLGDVSPSQRKGPWKDVAIAASAGVVGALAFEDASDLMILMQIETDYPSVLASAKYTKPRNEAALKGLEMCFANSWGVEHCVKVLKKLIDHTPDDKAFILQASKVARRGMNPYGATPFFVRALGGKNNDAVCKDDDLQYATVAGVATPKSGAWLAPSLKIADVCFAQLKKQLVKAYDEDSESGYVRRNTCEFLKKKKALSPAQDCPKPD